MPTGNHHASPPGLWWRNPTTPSIPRLILGSACKIGYLAIGLVAFYSFRSMSWNYTYTNFLGKTMTLGQKSRLTHEPLSVAEIDRLKEEERARKRGL